ncbi:MAG: E3 ubiquitin-protein ligase rad18 [Caeruleum heppii]|nr:MAG: E3 ubiquitin-protein ligase rad18 [Caeruleum heppii]
MDHASTLSDSTDWLHTSLPRLAPVESALRCQVCKDFYTTPMMTSCSHTFCSLCIRRCLASDGKCPTCRASEQEVKLRRNWTVQELVDAFGDARESVLLLARRSREENASSNRKAPKRKLRDTDAQDDDDDPSRPRKTRSQTQAKREIQESQPLKGAGAPQSRVTEQQVERLPKLNYSLYKENALRKKLNELGIRASGPKSLLERRHTEWVNIWNANCDSLKPRPRRDILHDLDIWERSQGNLASGSTGSSSAGASVMRKDFDGLAWAASHNNDFQRLIANAKHRRGPADNQETTKTDVSDPSHPSSTSRSPDGVASAATDGSDPAMDGEKIVDAHSARHEFDSSNAQCVEAGAEEQAESQGPPEPLNSPDADSLGTSKAETPLIPRTVGVKSIEQSPHLPASDHGSHSNICRLAPAVKSRMFEDHSDPIADGAT